MRIECNAERPRFKGGKRISKKIQAALANLIPIDGKIKRAKVATAYIDALALFGLIKYIETHADGRSGATVEIFAQRSSLQALWNELDQPSQPDSLVNQKDPQWKKRLRTYFKKSGQLKPIRGVKVSIYAVSYQTLFHSKAIYLETNTSQIAIVGSLNLTVNGLLENEELVVNTGQQNINDDKHNKLINQFIRSVDQYISFESFKNIFGNFGRVAPFSVTKRAPAPLTLRDILLNGRIWYERKEIEAFAFPLKLPGHIRKAAESLIRSDIPYLKSNLGSSISVLDLIEQSFQTARNESPRWRRKFCIPTCYGLWSPREWCIDIRRIRDERSNDRQRRFEQIREIFSIGEPTEKIVMACDEIWSKLQDGGCSISELLINDTKRRAHVWVNAVANKLADNAYFEVLVTGLSDVDVPDIWAGNPGDAVEFQRTFLDSVEFEMQRPRARSLLAKRLNELLVRNDQAMEPIDLPKLMLSDADKIFGKTGENDGSDVDDDIDDTEDEF